ncbi:MAG: methyltransferase domain-containing protein [Proteobacteria bacterium]|nr:methyltransferase domain-containing protein [Pseudomonadota bacterium]
MTVQGHRTLKIEKLARIYDDEVAPVWGSRFGKMLLRNLVVPDKGQVLDISCGTGYPTTEILRRMTDGRVIAIDASSAMLDVARRKIGELGPLAKKVFFRTESPVPKLSFADDVYDLVVCNLGLSEMPDLDSAVRDFSRVAKRGGEVRCTLPLAGTFQEFHDIYREVLIKHDKHDALDRLEQHIARYPTPEDVERSMRAANLVGDLEVEEFTLLFKSSREFFFAPVIEYGPLAEWKDIAGSGQEMQDVFWYIKEAIDAYYDRRPFQITVAAGCLIGRKHDLQGMQAAERARISRPVIAVVAPTSLDDAAQFDEVDTGLPSPPAQIAAGSEIGPGAFQVEIVDDDDFEIDEASAEEQALDAFIEGKRRPPHLDGDLDDLDLDDDTDD